MHSEAVETSTRCFMERLEKDIDVCSRRVSMTGREKTKLHTAMLSPIHT